jgi:hypothetical protein
MRASKAIGFQVFLFGQSRPNVLLQTHEGKGSKPCLALTVPAPGFTDLSLAKLNNGPDANGSGTLTTATDDEGYYLWHH